MTPYFLTDLCPIDSFVPRVSSSNNKWFISNRYPYSLVNSAFLNVLTFTSLNNTSVHTQVK